jgi:hypothetical protein
MNVNALRELMAFADENNMFGRGWSDSASSYDPKGRRAMWAAEMMGQQQRPDFFQGAGFQGDMPQQQAPAYVRPERSSPMQVTRGAPDPMRAQTMNYLAKYLGR